MTETAQKTKFLQRVGKVLSAVILAVLCILLLLVIAIKIYLSTSLPSQQLSRKVSSSLQQNFVVKSIDSSGDTIILHGVALQNPPGFPKRTMAAADSVAIAPQWGALVRGEQRYRLLALDGITINLEKDRKGVWNFTQLQNMLAARKPSKAETFIKELVIKNGSLKVQGEGLQGLSLHAMNVATKGSLESSIDLSFDDTAHNRYFIKGKARPGENAAVDLTLTAPAISLKDAAALLKSKNAAAFEGGKGALRLNATLLKGDFTAAGVFSFAGMHLPAGAGNFPMAGALNFRADYSTRADTVNLRNCTLTVDRLAKVHAEGRASRLKGDRDFEIRARIDEMDLGTANVLVSEQARKGLLVGGRVRCDSLHLAGSRSGLKTATGLVRLHDGSIRKRDQLLLSGLSGTVDLSRTGGAILAKGKASASGRESQAVVESLDMPFAVTMSSKLKPVAAQVPAFSAVVAAIPIRGRLSFDAAKADPLAASLTVPDTELSRFNGQLKRYGVHASGGSVAFTVDASGKSASEFDATAKARLANVRASRGKESFAVSNGVIDAKVRNRGGEIAAQGSSDLARAALDGKMADARFAFTVADKMIHLSNVRASVAGSDISVAHLSGPIPVKEVSGNVTRYPVVVDLDGGSVKQRQVEVDGLSGRLRGSFNSEGRNQWLEGTADLASSMVKLQGKKVAAPVVKGSFSKSGGKAAISGELAGGKLSGTTIFNPFAPDSGATFDAVLVGADLKKAAELFSKGPGLHPSDGVADVTVKGSYSRGGGLNCRFQSKGSGITVVDAQGKNLVSGAGLSLAGELQGGNLVISDSVLSAGPGVHLKLKGELAQALKPERAGVIFLSLPQTPMAGIIDPFVNILPRLIQEATVDGAVAADGKLTLKDGKELFEGALTVKGGRMEVPSQKLLVADIDGTLPFSLDISGKERGRPEALLSFSRDNYPALLEEFKKGRRGGDVLTVGTMALGGLQLGKLTMYVTAKNGVTDITSLNTTMFEGTVLGRGFVMMRSKLIYRTDLLINNVSLKALCNMFPNIQGDISGRVDGVLSLRGRGSGLTAITGFTDLWAREGSGEKMLVSKEFLQRLAKQKLSGFLFRRDRRYDRAEIKAMLQEGDLTFDILTIEHTNLVGVRDLSVSIAPSQNRISLEHLLDSIKEAAVRGTPARGAPAKAQPAEEEPAPAGEFKWGE